MSVGPSCLAAFEFHQRLPSFFRGFYPSLKRLPTAPVDFSGSSGVLPTPKTPSRFFVLNYRSISGSLGVLSNPKEHFLLGRFPTLLLFRFFVDFEQNNGPLPLAFQPPIGFSGSSGILPKPRTPSWLVICQFPLRTFVYLGFTNPKDTFLVDRFWTSKRFSFSSVVLPVSEGALRGWSPSKRPVAFLVPQMCYPHQRPLPVWSCFQLTQHFSPSSVVLPIRTIPYCLVFRISIHIKNLFLAGRFSTTIIFSFQ